jgi:UDP-N-acetylglucosamine 4,6-dehydratase
MFKDKTLLITGGTGSFGNAVLKRFLDTDIGEIRILSRDEKKQDDMRKLYANPKLKFYIGDVRDRNSILEAIDGSDFIFHAAALKQVPSCEFYPIEAVKTNVLGAGNVLDIAAQYGVKKVVVLSTDKAAYPINAMGMTKALMEKIATAKARSIGDKGTIICRTRYGNVMASRGSVIPVFKEQMLNGYDVTVTDENMTRFMMTLDDAVDLVLYAFQNGQQGDLFVQKAPAATIKTLVEAMAKMLNVTPMVRNIGVRHGEKMYETLVTREEMAYAEDIGDYYRIPMDARDLNYAVTDEARKGCGEQEFNSDVTRMLNVDEMVELLRKAVTLNE